MNISLSIVESLVLLFIENTDHVYMMFYFMLQGNIK